MFNYDEAEDDDSDVDGEPIAVPKAQPPPARSIAAPTAADSDDDDIDGVPLRLMNGVFIQNSSSENTRAHRRPKIDLSGPKCHRSLLVIPTNSDLVQQGLRLIGVCFFGRLCLLLGALVEHIALKRVSGYTSELGTPFSSQRN